MNRFLPGNRITLLRNGDQYFPALIARDRRRTRDGLVRDLHLRRRRNGAAASPLRSIRAAQRGVNVRALVDGWGAKFYLTAALEREMRDGGVDFQKYRPEVAPWQFRTHRLRRLHRKLCVM